MIVYFITLTLHYFVWDSLKQEKRPSKILLTRKIQKGRIRMGRIKGGHVFLDETRLVWKPLLISLSSSAGLIKERISYVGERDKNWLDLSRGRAAAFRDTLLIKEHEPSRSWFLSFKKHKGILSCCVFFLSSCCVEVASAKVGDQTNPKRAKRSLSVVAAAAAAAKNNMDHRTNI